jgi:hypothetical protein
MRYLLIVAAALALAGCGPLMGPMTVRLKAEEQKVVDGMWNNMLTPTNRLDHELLLDVLCENGLFQIGVDRLHMVAEKEWERGRVVMEIDCDRGAGEADQFTVTLLDERGRTVRRERYGRSEVEARMPLATVTSQSEMVEVGPPTAEQDRRRVEIERRRERIRAATQPIVERS